MSSAVSYSSLSQGQGDNQTGVLSVNSKVNGAPMAKAEVEDFDEPDGIGNGNSNVPRVAIANPNTNNTNTHHEDLDVKSNNGFEVDNVDHPDHMGDLRPNTAHSYGGRFPHLNFDTELGSIAGETLPDINVYQHKKTLAQGMMDLALFSANANQLRYVLDSFSRHPYYWPSVVLISLSLAFQISVGIGLIWNALYDIKNEDDLHIANRINNFTVIGIFLVVVLNVFISVFAISDPILISQTVQTQILQTPKS